MGEKKIVVSAAYQCERIYIKISEPHLGWVFQTSQVQKWVQENLMPGVNLRWTNSPSMVVGGGGGVFVNASYSV